MGLLDIDIVHQITNMQFLNLVYLFILILNDI